MGKMKMTPAIRRAKKYHKMVKEAQRLLAKAHAQGDPFGASKDVPPPPSAFKRSIVTDNLLETKLLQGVRPPNKIRACVSLNPQTYEKLKIAATRHGYQVSAYLNVLIDIHCR